MKFTTKKDNAFKLIIDLYNSQDYVKRVIYKRDKVEILEFKSEEVSYIVYIFNGQLAKYKEYVNGDMTEFFIK